MEEKDSKHWIYAFPRWVIMLAFFVFIFLILSSYVDGRPFKIFSYKFGFEGKGLFSVKELNEEIASLKVENSQLKTELDSFKAKEDNFLSEKVRYLELHQSWEESFPPFRVVFSEICCYVDDPSFGGERFFIHLKTPESSSSHKREVKVGDTMEFSSTFGETYQFEILETNLEKQKLKLSLRQLKN